MASHFQFQEWLAISEKAIRCQKWSVIFKKWPAVFRNERPFSQMDGDFQKWPAAIFGNGQPFLEMVSHFQEWPATFNNDQPFSDTFKNGRPLSEMAGNFHKCQPFSFMSGHYQLKAASHFRFAWIGISIKKIISSITNCIWFSSKLLILEKESEEENL